MSEETDHNRRLSTYGQTGAVLSILVIVVFSIYVYIEWSGIKVLKPNEFGDFISGLLSPLAFLWLVLGFFQQGEELRHSVRALELQSEELKNSVEQQAALVQVTREQAAAELAALHDERQARRAAISPRFTIHADGGGRSGTLLKQRLVLHNVGAVASDTRIILRSDKVVFVDRIYTVLREGETENLSIEYTISDRPEKIIANIVSKNRFGEEVTQVTELVADRENLLRYNSIEIAIQ